MSTPYEAIHEEILIDLNEPHHAKTGRRTVFQTRQNCHPPVGRATFESCPTARKIVHPHIIFSSLETNLFILSAESLHVAWNPQSAGFV